MLLEIIICPHGVQDGGHLLLAHGALGFVVGPGEDAGIAEAVQAGHDKAGLPASVQTDVTAVLPRCALAAPALPWPGGTSGW